MSPVSSWPPYFLINTSFLFLGSLSSFIACLSPYSGPHPCIAFLKDVFSPYVYDFFACTNASTSHTYSALSGRGTWHWSTAPIWSPFKKRSLWLVFWWEPVSPGAAVRQDIPSLTVFFLLPLPQQTGWTSVWLFWFSLFLCRFSPGVFGFQFLRQCLAKLPGLALKLLCNLDRAWTWDSPATGSSVAWATGLCHEAEPQ